MAYKKILVTGVSGTGKTTVLRELEKQGFATVGLDETPGLSHWVHKKTGEKLVKKADFSKEFLSEYEWVCDLEMLDSLLAQYDESVVVAGNVENILECMEYCDETLLLVCAPETFFARIDTRSDNEYGQSDEAKEFIMSYYERDNKKCLEAGAIAIDAEQSVEKVVEDVMEYIK